LPPLPSSARIRSLQPAAIAALSLACSNTPSASFSGPRFPPASTMSNLDQRTYVPHDHRPIGTVTASCEHEGNQDDRCSELVLLRVMRQRAASAGGTAFVKPSCEYRTVSPGRRGIACTATVARRRSLLRSPPGGVDASAPQQRRWEILVDGTKIEVTARPRPGVTPTPRPVTEIRRQWEPGRPEHALGSLRGRCLQPCPRSAAIQGLKHGAAWLGAGTVTAVRCVQTSAGRWTCTGDAADR